jgi:hypothetical protein
VAPLPAAKRYVAGDLRARSEGYLEYSDLPPETRKKQEAYLRDR